MSIKEIGYAVGYKHAPSFVRAFERVFEQAPSQYRQEMLTVRRFR
jgi:AraC-like DNA-binding protein